MRKMLYMFVYLNRSFLIVFEYTDTVRAVTCALSRVKSEKKRGGGVRARLSDFYVRWSPLPEKRTVV